MRRMFSEKQIENIADDRITNAIESGVISGGTQLYLHKIKVEGFTISAQQGYVNIISLDNTKVTDIDSNFNKLLKNSLYSFVSKGSSNDSLGKMQYDVICYDGDYITSYMFNGRTLAIGYYSGPGKVCRLYPKTAFTTDGTTVTLTNTATTTFTVTGVEDSVTAL